MFENEKFIDKNMHMNKETSGKTQCDLDFIENGKKTNGSSSSMQKSLFTEENVCKLKNESPYYNLSFLEDSPTMKMLYESNFSLDTALKHKLSFAENDCANKVYLQKDKNVNDGDLKNDLNEKKSGRVEFEEQENNETASTIDENELTMDFWKSKTLDHVCRCYMEDCGSVPFNQNDEARCEKQPENNNLVLNSNFRQDDTSQNASIKSSSSVQSDGPGGRLERTSPQRAECSLPEEVAHQVLVTSAGFQDIAGLEDVKQTLREAIIYPAKYPHLFKNGRSAWSRALLMGAPGVGKTALAHAAAAEAHLPLYQVSSADLMNAWVGNTEKLIRLLFSTLGCKRCILLLDEVDCLCRKRETKDSESGRRAASELLIQMQRYEGSPMFLLCATNCPWEIDPAFLRRLQQRIYVPMPDVLARESILVSCIGRMGSLQGGAEWGRFLGATAGLSGSDLRGLARTALMLPLREMRSATHWLQTCGMMVPTCKSNIMAVCFTLDQIPPWKVWCRQLQIGDLWKALEDTDRTVTDDLLQLYRNFVNGRKIIPHGPTK